MILKNTMQEDIQKLLDEAVSLTDDEKRVVLTKFQTLSVEQKNEVVKQLHSEKATILKVFNSVV